MKTFRTTLIALLIGFFSITSSASAAGNWDWTVALYLWGSDISLDMTVNGDPALGVDVAFGDLVDKLEMAGALHFEGQRGHWGFFTDIFYVDLASGRDIALPPPLPGSVDASTGLTETIFEVAATYSPSGTTEGFTLFGGVRVLDIDQVTVLRFPLPSEPSVELGIAETIVDGMLGARYATSFSDRWGMVLRGDFSTGDSEIIWNGSGMLSIEFGKTGKYSGLLGYRYLAVELEDKSGPSERQTEITMSGPIAAFVIKF